MTANYYHTQWSSSLCQLSNVSSDKEKTKSKQTPHNKQQQQNQTQFQLFALSGSINEVENSLKLGVLDTVLLLWHQQSSL